MGHYSWWEFDKEKEIVVWKIRLKDLGDMDRSEEEGGVERHKEVGPRG